MSGNEYQLVKLETHILKVHIHCEGCARKVKKVLKRIEGVYQVRIEAEEQKVTVSGTVDSAALIRKLIKSRKYAEVWSPRQNTTQSKNLQGLTNWLTDYNYQNPEQGPINGYNASDTQPIMATAFDRGLGDWRSEKYLNKSVEDDHYLMGKTDDSFSATSMGKNELAWDGNTVSDPSNMEGNTRSIIGFQDFANNAGGFAGIEDTGFAGLQRSGLPAYEHYYSPFMMMNNITQRHYDLPYPMMMNRSTPDLSTICNMTGYNNSCITTAVCTNNKRIMNPMFNMHSPVTYLP